MMRKVKINQIKIRRAVVDGTSKESSEGKCRVYGSITVSGGCSINLTTCAKSVDGVEQTL